VMSAIERCRTVALGGHVARCEGCAHTVIAYNSCLMGKFRNGEVATRCIGVSVDFRDLTLQYGPSLGNAVSLSGGRTGPLRRYGGAIASMASHLSLRPQRRRISVIAGFPASDPQRPSSECSCAAHSTISRRADLGGRPL